MDFKFFIAVTAFNPLSRVEKLLKLFSEYEKLPGTKDIFIYIDWNHREDIAFLQNLIQAKIEGLSVQAVVCSPLFEGFELTWAHKEDLKNAVLDKSYDFYVYSEDDMLFTLDNFNYWLSCKDKLSRLNLEPGFCRFERRGTSLVPFDNYGVWNIGKATPDVWRDIPYVCTTYKTAESDFWGFVSLANPYSAFMLLDQSSADRYIESDSFCPNKSFVKVAHRNWPLADRSSMGVAFEDLLPYQEHKRVVPVNMNEKGELEIAQCGLIEHLDNRYSEDLASKHTKLITTKTMFALSENT